MGSCVSRSGATMSEPSGSSVHALIAKVVDLDGSMAQFAAPVTAHDALASATTTAGGRASSPARFLCCSDELDFDAPVRAVGARDALRPGQLYFALPLSMLGRPLPAQDMAALAVKACAALGSSPVVVAAADTGVPSSDGSEASNNRAQRQRRVAPLVVVSAHADNDGVWKNDRVHGGYGDARIKVESGDRTVGKARQGAVGGIGVDRRFVAVQRLSAIVEADNE